MLAIPLWAILGIKCNTYPSGSFLGALARVVFQLDLCRSWHASMWTFQALFSFRNKGHPNWGIICRLLLAPPLQICFRFQLWPSQAQSGYIVVGNCYHRQLHTLRSGCLNSNVRRFVHRLVRPSPGERRGVQSVHSEAASLFGRHFRVLNQWFPKTVLGQHFSPKM